MVRMGEVEDSGKSSERKAGSSDCEARYVWSAVARKLLKFLDLRGIANKIGFTYISSTIFTATGISVTITPTISHQPLIHLFQFSLCSPLNLLQCIDLIL